MFMLELLRYMYAFYETIHVLQTFLLMRLKHSTRMVR